MLTKNKGQPFLKIPNIPQSQNNGGTLLPIPLEEFGMKEMVLNRKGTQ